MFGITVGLHHGSLDGSTCIMTEKNKAKYTDEKRSWTEVSPEKEENKKT